MLRIVVNLFTLSTLLTSCGGALTQEDLASQSALDLNTPLGCGIRLASSGAVSLSLNENGTGSCSVAMDAAIDRTSHLYFAVLSDDFVTAEFVFLSIPEETEISVGKTFSGLVRITNSSRSNSGVFQTPDSACTFKIEAISTNTLQGNLDYRVSGRCSEPAKELYMLDETHTPRTVSIEPFEFRTYDRIR